jgi:hypothetical protein
MVNFEEPDSNGGVSVLRYKVDWRQPGQDWSSREFEVETGESHDHFTPLEFCIAGKWEV